MNLAFILDAPSGVPAERIQIAKLGDFTDPRYGEFSFTKDEIEKWARNLAKLPGGRAPIDLDHSPEKEGKTDAAGWITRISLDGDTPMADVEWTPLGDRVIREKRYLFISPSIADDYADEHGQTHGSALVGAGLTNRPFLNMPAVCLSKKLFDLTDALEAVSSGHYDGATVEDEQPEDPEEASKYTLDTSDDYREKHATVVKKIDGKTVHMFPIAPGDKDKARAALRLLPKAVKAGHLTDSEAAKVKRKAESELGSDSRRAMDLTPGILKALGVEDEEAQAKILDQAKAGDFTEEKLLEAVTAAKPAPEKPKTLDKLAEEQGSMVLSKADYVALKAGAEQGASARKQLDQMRFDSTWTKAVSEGRIAAAQREEFQKLYDIEPDSTVAILDKAPKILNTERQGASSGATAAPADAKQAVEQEMDVQIKNLMAAEKIDYAEAARKLMVSA